MTHPSVDTSSLCSSSDFPMIGRVYVKQAPVMSVLEVRVTLNTKLLQLLSLLQLISGEGAIDFREQTDNRQNYYLGLCADLAQDCADLSDHLDKRVPVSHTA